MASFTNIIDKGARTYKLGGGLELKATEVTLSPASTDYNSGITIQANAAKIGMRRVVAVVAIGAQSSNGSNLGVTFNYNTSTGKLMGYKGNGSAVLTEVGASDLGDGCVVRMIVLGS